PQRARLGAGARRSPRGSRGLHAQAAARLRALGRDPAALLLPRHRAGARRRTDLRKSVSGRLSVSKRRPRSAAHPPPDRLRRPGRRSHGLPAARLVLHRRRLRQVRRGLDRPEPRWARRRVRRQGYRVLLENAAGEDARMLHGMQQRLEESGVNGFVTVSRGVLSHYGKEATLWVKSPRGEVPIGDYTPLYERYAEA